MPRLTHVGERRTIRMGWISLAANLTLTMAKVLTGALTGSTALVADGLHNGADALASAVSWAALRAGALPPDADHPYGHARFENAAALFTGIVLLALAVDQGAEAMIHLATGRTVVPGILAQWVALLSIGAKAGLYWATRRVLRMSSVRSPALAAQATDHLMDVASSGLAAVAIGLARTGFPAADNWGTLAIAILIALVAIDIGRRTVDDLTDRYTNEASLRHYQEIARAVSGVRDVVYVRARTMGAYAWLDVEVATDGKRTLESAHAVARTVKDQLEADPSVTGATVRVVPFAAGARNEPSGRNV